MGVLGYAHFTGRATPGTDSSDMHTSGGRRKSLLKEIFFDEVALVRRRPLVGGNHKAVLKEIITRWLTTTQQP